MGYHKVNSKKSNFTLFLINVLFYRVNGTGIAARVV